jgi:hypothetical protein
MVIWEIVLTLVIMISQFWLPLYLSFCIVRDTSITIIEDLTIGILAMDVLLKFNTAYLCEGQVKNYHKYSIVNLFQKKDHSELHNNRGPDGLFISTLFCYDCQT